MKTFRNILRTLLFIIVLTLVGLSIVVQVPSVQSRLTGRVATWLSETTGADVSVGEVNFLLFNRLIINDLLLRTAPSDTLLYADKVSVTLNGINPLSKKIKLRRILISRGSFHLISQDSTSNIKTMFHASGNKDTTGKHETSF